MPEITRDIPRGDSGDRHIVPAGAGGAWAGHGGDVAVWNGSGWDFYRPETGWKGYAPSDDSESIFYGGTWRNSIMDFLHRNAIRYYPFAVQPVATRNTFANSAITFDLPGLYLSLGTSVTEINKMYEARVERRLNDEFIEGPANRDGADYTRVIGCQFWANTSVPANTDETAYAGIQFWSYGVAPPFPSIAGQAVIQLRQHLKSKGTWDLIASIGDGSATASTQLTNVPNVPPGEGHRVQLISDPSTNTVSGIIDNVVIGPIPFNFGNRVPYNLNNDESGFFITSGVATGVSAITADFSSFYSAHLNTHLP